MNTESFTIKIGVLAVQVVRKDIKNLHLGVYPPDGRVRVAAPVAISDNAVRLAVIKKMGWIKLKKEQFAKQPRQSKREMVSGESHYYLGQRRKLVVNNKERKTGVCLKGKNKIIMNITTGTSIIKRETMLNEWYRRQMKKLVPQLLDKWEDKIGVRVNKWGIKLMKTKWGSCNPKIKSIWLNLELIKKPVGCIEYIIVHELAHLVERKHNGRFKEIVNNVMPKWSQYKKELNVLPLSYLRS
jgi:hypothetical protein